MQSERKIHADINQARDGWIQVTLSGEGAAELTEAQIEAALSAAEPWPFEHQNYNCPCIHPSQCDESCVKKPAPSVAVKALADAYKAGFDASSQGYNGEVFPEYEADNEWLAQRDSDLSALSAQVQDVTEGWNVLSNHGAVLIYCLKQDGWRKGEPVLVNDVTIRIENANRSNHDLTQIAGTILRALPAAPAKQEGKP